MVTSEDMLDPQLEDFRDWLVRHDNAGRGHLILEQFPLILDGGYTLDQCHDATGLVRAGVKGGIALWIAENVSTFKQQKKASTINGAGQALQNLRSNPPPVYGGGINRGGNPSNPFPHDERFFED